MRMITELRIENLLLIERAELSLSEGLNTFTGETGAGKTMLAHAIDLLLGGRSKRGIVRPGAGEAWVEGTFRLPHGLLERPEFAELRDRLPDADAEEVALARRVSPEGRTRAYIEGRSATAADLKLLGGRLVNFYGQHEHRKLTLAGAQLSVLDAFAGATTDKKHLANLAELAALHQEALRLQEALTELELLEGRRERELGLIEFELAEIEALAPRAEDEAALTAERDRLQAVDELRMATSGALAVIDDDDAAGGAPAGAAALLARAAAALEDPAGADAELDALAARLGAAVLELQDVAADLRAFAGGLAADPERLAAVNARLDDYERLKRKHGGSLEAVLAHAERCREDQSRLRDSGQRSEEAAQELAATRRRQDELASAASKARRSAAPKLAAAVRERLAGLAMDAATFEISIERTGGDPGPTGHDRVEFMIAANPGIAAAPLRETASGGELSRVMLALLTAAADVAGDATGETFVFDEVDAGIGGHTARAVGERLRELGQGRQVICITHLPQVAAAADRHFQIAKRQAGAEAVTSVNALSGDAVVEELCRMLGADADDRGARRHAEELLAAV